MSFIRQRPILTGALSLGAAGSVAIYFGKRYLDRSCPRVPIGQVPKSSACRNLVDTATNTGVPYTPHGLEEGRLLGSWSGRGGNDDRWIHSFAALQIELPTSLLAGYNAAAGGHSSEDVHPDDADHLMRNLVAAFLNGRAKGPDGWLLDEEVPALTFKPGSLLFGKLNDFVAFMLGTWKSPTSESAARGLQPMELPWDAAEPTSRFPSNSALVQKSPTEAAGAVMYWHFPLAVLEKVDRAAAYGWPWRFMLGGYQEWIVEKLSNDKVRVTYVMAECSESKSDFKPLPSVGYEIHVLYGQSLLDRAVKELKRASLEQKGNGL